MKSHEIIWNPHEIYNEIPSKSKPTWSTARQSCGAWCFIRLESSRRPWTKAFVAWSRDVVDVVGSNRVPVVFQCFMVKYGKIMWLWINTYKNTFFSGMNIHFNPAILMWTTGDSMGFDTLPCKVLFNPPELKLVIGQNLHWLVIGKNNKWIHRSIPSTQSKSTQKGEYEPKRRT